MHYAPVYLLRTTTDVGGDAIGPGIVGLRAVASWTVVGGSAMAFSWSAADFPRNAAAAVKARVLPIVSNNSEQIAFPPAVPRAMIVSQIGMTPARLGEIPGRGEWWVQTRQRPKPLWFAITGVTRDNTGAALGACTVKLFQTSNDAMIATMVSDASGNYTFWLRDSTSNYYVVSYKTGAPDVAGTTLNTLKGA